MHGTVQGSKQSPNESAVGKDMNKSGFAPYGAVVHADALDSARVLAPNRLRSFMLLFLLPSQTSTAISVFGRFVVKGVG